MDVVCNACIPIALRRLRHVEFFTFVSRGNFATSHTNTKRTDGDDNQHRQQHQQHQTATTTQSPTSPDGVALLSSSSSPALAAASVVNNENNFTDNNFSSHANCEMMATPSSYDYFFPDDDRSFCRLELWIPIATDSAGGVGCGGAARENSNNNNIEEENNSHSLEETHRLLYTSERVAPTRHPRFAPLSADVRNVIGTNVDRVVVRIIAETDLRVSFENRLQQPETHLVPLNFSNHQRNRNQNNNHQQDENYHEDFTATGAGGGNFSRRAARVSRVGGGNDENDNDNNQQEEEDFSVSSFNNGSGNTDNDDQNHIRRVIMTEIPLEISQLTYLADNIADATDILQNRRRQQQQQQQQQARQQQQHRRRGSLANSVFNNEEDGDDATAADQRRRPMYCLVVCNDGVFVVDPKRDDAAANRNQNQSTSENENHHQHQLAIEALKYFGQRRAGATGAAGGGSGTARGGGGGGGEEWDLVPVASSQEADRVSVSQVMDMVDSTMTSHFAELVIKRRCFLEKQRLVQNMRAQLQHQSSSSSDERQPGGEEEEAEDEEEFPPPPPVKKFG